jgi:hypothetical protein
MANKELCLGSIAPQWNKEQSSVLDALTVGSNFAVNRMNLVPEWTSRSIVVNRRLHCREVRLRTMLTKVDIGQNAASAVPLRELSCVSVLSRVRLFRCFALHQGIVEHVGLPKRYSTPSCRWRSWHSKADEKRGSSGLAPTARRSIWSYMHSLTVAAQAFVLSSR